ncbi:MAG: PAS domain-containing protein [Hydrogenimonas sp.]|nr:PAS domain-containing protein [Hydrogenimonas sp.]
MAYVVNSITGAKIVKPTPLDEEVPFDGGVMITETDTAGIITYANRKFREMTGYTKEELIGSPHSINRHPDMPKSAFKTMWETIKRGEMWEGYVKNMRKDGKYYWVIVWIKPKFDDEGNIVGYIAGRKVPNRHDIKQVEMQYKKMAAQELKS